MGLKTCSLPPPDAIYILYLYSSEFSGVFRDFSGALGVDDCGLFPPLLTKSKSRLTARQEPASERKGYTQLTDCARFSLEV